MQKEVSVSFDHKKTLSMILLDLNNVIALILAVVANFMVILLAYRIQNREIRAFRWIIAMQSLVELISAITIFLLEARYYDVNGDVDMFVTGLMALLPPNGALTILVLNENMELLAILVLPFAFVYQYMRICRSANINSLWVRVMVTSAVGVMCTLVAFNSYLIVVSIMYLLKTDLLGYAVIVAHDANSLAVGRMVMFGAPSIVVYVIAGFCAFKSLKKIAERSVSEQTKRLQRQFTVLISLQALLPFVFYTLPTCAAYTAVYAGFSPTAIMRVYVALNAWGKCIHPVLCFVFMRPLRIAFKELVPKIARTFRTPIEEIAEAYYAKNTAQRYTAQYTVPPNVYEPKRHHKPIHYTISPTQHMVSNTVYLIRNFWITLIAIET